MIEIDSGLLALLAVITLAAFATWRYTRIENAKNERWLAAMQEMSRRCPDCRGDTFHLGKMRPDGSYETFECPTCNGTGKWR